MQWRDFRVRLSREPVLRKSELNQYRIMVFEPSSQWSGNLTWKGEVEVVAQSGNSRGRANDKKVLSTAAFDDWLKANPVPTGSASEKDIARYLVALLKKTNQLQRSLPREHKIVAPLAALVEGHFPIFVGAIQGLELDQHNSRRLLEEAVAVGITESQFQANLEEVSKIRPVWLAARKRGWFKPLGDVLAKGARNGNSLMLEEAILLPEKAGLSNEECVMLFNLKPKVSLYYGLSENRELRALLDKEIERALSESVRKVSYVGGDIDKVLTLALASGQPQAPKILQEVLRQAVPEGEVGMDYESIYRRYFVFDDRTYDHLRWLADFLKTDPHRWVFDEGENKYRFNPNQLGGESS